MKKISVTLLLLVTTLTMQAQEKLAWETNVNKASERALKEKKPLLLFFTGSDWCGWCIKLQNEVMKTPEFTAWAKENVILVELDYPRRSPQLPETQQQNAEMQQMFQVRGYPTVWLVNPTKKDGKFSLDRLGSTGYVAGGPSKWLETANQILANKGKS